MFDPLNALTLTLIAALGLAALMALPRGETQPLPTLEVQR